MKHRLPADPIDENAARWAMRLECGALAEDEQAAFSAWLDAAPAHRQAFEEYRALSSQLDAHIEVHLGAAAEEARRRRTLARKWKRGGAALVAAAAVLAAIIALANGSRDFATGSAERHVLALEDGSKIELNAQSAVSADFRRGERRVRLRQGEALFEVAKDAHRPFVVETSAGSVRAIGTAFDVRSTRSQRVEVTVLEGTVQIEAKADRANAQRVSSGQQATVSPEAIAVRTLPEGAIFDAVAWRQGQVVFDETPLSEVFERFAAYHTRHITVEPGAADLRLGGRYSLGDLDGLLESIERVLPVRVSNESDGSLRIAPVDGSRLPDATPQSSSP